MAAAEVEYGDRFEFALVRVLAVMSPKPSKILLTGLPGCGKTTAVVRIAESLPSVKVVGFYSEEIREDDRRKGFRWTRLDGPTGMLAHVKIKSRFKVGRYKVDVAGFEEAVVPVLDADRSDAELFIIDEIGKMECLSQRFVAAVRRLLASDKSVLATVAKKGTGLIREVKTHPDTELTILTRDNRDQVTAEILQALSFPETPS
ncbi:MAG: NTPase [Phycisphaerales bacterium]|nr:MAG: NTPase [Phycisphaerales bacterium]